MVVCIWRSDSVAVRLGTTGSVMSVCYQLVLILKEHFAVPGLAGLNHSTYNILD